MLRTCMRLLKDIDLREQMIRVRQRCMRRQIVKISRACILMILGIGGLEAGLILLIL